MSFSQSVKKEINQKEYGNDCCALAALSGLLHTAGSILRNSKGIYAEVESQSELDGFLQSTLVRLYGMNAQVFGEDGAFKKTNIYRIPSEISKSVLTDCGIIRYDEEGKLTLVSGIDQYLIQEDCCKSAFVRGAFLGGGSISGTEDGGSLHTEFVLNGDELAGGLVSLFLGVDIPAHAKERRGKAVVYIKGREAISDVLAFMEVPRAVLRLNEQLVLRDVKNNINRGNNCLSANIDKMVSTELRQLEDIEYIRDTVGLGVLDYPLRMLAEFRLNNENVSYGAISDALKIAKSTVSSRMKKITDIASALRRGKSNV